MQPLADAAGGEQVRSQYDEVTELGQSVIAVRSDDVGAPAANDAVGDLRYGGNVELSDAEGSQCIHDLAGPTARSDVAAIPTLQHFRFCYRSGQEVTTAPHRPSPDAGVGRWATTVCVGRARRR